MRKIMMAALFSVISLSACAVEDPSQSPAEDGVAFDRVAECSDQTIDESEILDPRVNAHDRTNPCQANSPEPTDETGEPLVNRALTPEDGRMSSDVDPVIEAIPCDRDEECPTNVCDEEIHRCRLYPF